MLKEKVLRMNIGIVKTVTREMDTEVKKSVIFRWRMNQWNQSIDVKCRLFV